MNIKILFLLLTSTLIFSSAAIAADPEKPTIYIIKKGDTLWGLSERFIKDPNYWPQMWSKNGQITNPHFIYPGQQVRVFPDHLEFIPKEQQSKTAANGSQKAGANKASEQKETVASEKMYSITGSEGFIMESDTIPDGVITSINHNRVIAGMDDIVYTNLGSSNGVKGGEKYDIYRKEIIIKHPHTGNIIGTKVTPLGSLQLQDVESNASRAVITASYREITSDAYILKPRSNGKKEIALKEPVSTLSGYVVESFRGTSMIASGDVVFIDIGTTQGAEVGNMLYIVRDVKTNEAFYERAKATLPQELIGAVVIIETGNKSSTALVVKSVETIYKGDKIVSATR